MFRFLSLCMLLVAMVGCQLNRSLATLSPSQILGSERRARQGIAALEQGDLTKAEERLEQAVRLNKNDINHRQHYAEVLRQQEKHQEALQQLNEAVRLGPQNSQIWALRGRVKRLQAIQQGHSEQAIEMLHLAREDYLRAVSLAPDDKELLAELATVQMSCGQPEQALATWLAVQNLYSPGSEPAEVLIGKTETLAMLRRFDEAEANFMALRQRGLENSEAGLRLHETMTATLNSVRR